MGDDAIAQTLVRCSRAADQGGDLKSHSVAHHPPTDPADAGNLIPSDLFSLRS